LKVKAILQIQISRLIFLLKNYQSAGADQVWEQATAAFATLQATASQVSDPKAKGAFARVALGIITAVGLLVTATDEGLKRAVSIGNSSLELHSILEQWQQHQVPKIEHRKQDDSAESLGE
jgi:hypothetical protein